MEILLDANAMAVAHSVSEEEARPNLKCVRVGHKEIAAADGYILIRRPIPISGEGALLIRGDAILRALKLFEGRSVVLESAGETVTIKEQLPSNLHTAVTLSTKPLDATFPTLDDKFPAGEIIAQFAINPALLERVLRAIGDAPMIRFRVRQGERIPIEFVADKTNGLIMPMMCGESNYWHGDGKG